MDCNENNRWKIIIKKCINSDKKYCEIKKGNEFYKQMIRFINELDCITYKKNKDHKKYKNKVNILYQFLKKRMNLVEDYLLWKHIFNRLVDTYKKDNYNLKIKNIPVYQVTKHNHAVSPFIQEMLKNNKIDMLLHFDTHSDMNDINDYSNVASLFNKVIKKRKIKKYIKNMEQKIWDIGMPVTGFLAFYQQKYKNKDVKLVWTLPDWIPTATKEPIDSYIDKPFTRKNISLEEDDDNLTYKLYNKDEDDYKINFTKSRFKSSKDWKKIQKIIGKSSYILDIDLDYFVANGEELDNDEYQEDYYDVKSKYRIFYDEQVFMRFPRGPFNKYDSRYRKYKRNVEKEVKQIKNRMNIFLKGIKYLKNKGKIPSAIIICDSTSAPFAKRSKHHTHYNEYVPQQYALWIHMTIQSGLKKIFS